MDITISEDQYRSHLLISGLAVLQCPVSIADKENILMTELRKMNDENRLSFPINRIGLAPYDAAVADCISRLRKGLNDTA